MDGHRSMEFLPDERFSDTGRALTAEERAATARKKGLCPRCGSVQTHGRRRKGFRPKAPLTTEEAWQGICIACFPRQVPVPVLEAYRKASEKKRQKGGGAGANFRTTSAPSPVAASPTQQQRYPRPVVTGQPSSTGSSGGNPPRHYDSPQHALGSNRSGEGLNGSSGGSGGGNRSGRPLLRQQQQQQQPGGLSPAPLLHSDVVASSTQTLLQRPDPSTRTNVGGSRPPGSAGGEGRTEQYDRFGSEKTIQTYHREGSQTGSPLQSSGRSLPRNYIHTTSGGSKSSGPTRRLKKGLMMSVKDLGADDGTSNEDLLESLRENHEHPDLLKQTMVRIQQLFNDEEDETDGGDVENERSTASKLIHEIKDVMDSYREDASVLFAAAGALWRMSADSAIRKEEIVQEGLAGMLVNGLNRNQEDHEFAEQVLGTLTSLATSCGKNAAALAQAGCIDSVLEAIEKHQQWSGVLEWGCRCLYNLIHCNYSDDEDMETEIQKNMVTIEEAGGIAILVSAMKQHVNESVVQLWSLKLLHCLQRRSDDVRVQRVRKKMYDADFLPVAIKVLRARSASIEVFCLASELICTLLTMNEEPDPEAFDVVAECAPSIARVMAKETEEVTVQRAGCRLLSMLTIADGSERLSALKDYGAFRAIKNALERLLRDAGVVESGAWALWKLSTIPSSFESTEVNSALRVMDGAAIINAESRILRLCICGFVTNTFGAVAEVDISTFPISVVSQVFETNPQDGILCEHAACALARLGATFPDMVLEVMQNMNVQGIVDVCSHSSLTAKENIYSLLMVASSASSDFRESLLSSGLLTVLATDLEEAEGASFIDVLLNLVATLVRSEASDALTVPEDLVDAITSLVGSEKFEGSLRQKSFTAFRNLLLAPNVSFRLDGLVQELQAITDESSCTHEIRLEVCRLIMLMARRSQVEGSVALTDMFRCVVKVLSRYNDRNAEYHPDIHCVGAAAVSAITGKIKQTPIQVDHEMVGTIAESAYKVLECGSDDTQTMGHFLVTILNLCDVAQELLIQSGVIVLVIDVLTELQREQIIQQAGCAILSRLSAKGNLLAGLVIVETEGIDALSCALAVFPNDTHISRGVCKAFSHLSESTELRIPIVSQGGLHLLVSAITSHQDDENLLVYACSALENITSGIHDQILAELGIVEAMLSTVRKFPLSLTLQATCFGVLKNILLAGDTGKSAAMHANGMELLLAAIERFMTTPSILEPAFIVLQTLLTLAANRTRLIESRGVELVVNAMLASIEEETIQTTGCRSLRNFATDSSKQAWVHGAGGDQAILLAMRAHFRSETFQTEACLALSTLTAPVPGRDSVVVTCDEIHTIVSAMRRYPKSEKIAEHGCVVLCNFLSSPDNSSAFNSCQLEMKSAVSTAASRFPDRCAEKAGLLLTSLS